MVEKLRAAESTFKELQMKMADPEVAADASEFQKIAKAAADLEETVNTYRTYNDTEKQVSDAETYLKNEVSDDPEMAEFARAEITELRASLAQLQDKLRLQLVPRDPLDDRNIMLEIRAGAGGDEASIWAGDLMRMYQRYANNEGWKSSLVSCTQGESGGYKEVIIQISGNCVYSKLKWEAGVHRVQRVPATEAAGRVHTSTATVAVMPEVEDVDVQINPNDIELKFARASGAGGQVCRDQNRDYPLGIAVNVGLNAFRQPVLHVVPVVNITGLHPSLPAPRALVSGPDHCRFHYLCMPYKLTME